jgi:predicted TIM-barrel fold metal-dependent hydrolase
MQYPHSPDVEERETADDGFSSGWAPHHQPSEEYWIDCHTHMRETAVEDIRDAIGPWSDRLQAWRLRRTVAMDGWPEDAAAFSAAQNADDRFAWLARLDYDDPDIDGLEECLAAGASGLKLHNAPLMRNAVDPEVWHSEDWHAIFERMGEADRPVLWHVTQRLTDAPYTGGGRNTYWEDGWEAGYDCDNVDMMQSFLDVVDDHPETDFIGAHQLHVGFDRLAHLFAEYPNLHVDTSIGCFVRWGDRMYPQDRDDAREFVCDWPDRVLFGTDCILGQEEVAEFTYQQFLGHVRYVRQLRLPTEVLQQVSHRNTERLMGMDSLDVENKGALRP